MHLGGYWGICIMAALPLASPEKAEAKNYGLLTVEPRLLVTDDLSVAIPNITALSTDATHRKAVMARNPLAIPLNMIAGIVLVLVVALGAFGMNRAPGALLLLLLPAGLIIAAALVYGSTTLKPVEKVPEKWTYFLHVTTSGPVSMHFRAPTKQTIDAARRIISDKINDGDNASVYDINFEDGSIQKISAGKIESMGTVANGSGNQVSTGNGRVGTMDTMEAHDLPGALLGSGLFAAGITYRVDYSKQLPLVADWVRNFEQGGHTDIARRLAELEQLMKEGTPNAQTKGRVRDLTRELTSLLGGAADIAEFFGSIARLAGS